MAHRYSYEDAALAMQAGVAADEGAKDQTPKHLRVGVNSAMCDSAALARLLIEKGLITEAEYIDAVTREMNAEVERYEKSLADRFARPVTLSPGAVHIGKRAPAKTDDVVPPVDRSARTTIHGTPMGEHLEIEPHTGMQKDYVILTAEERAKGFVRPVRRSYKHETCGAVTTMGKELAETYARDPGFYSGTFCATCLNHFPVGAEGDFVWLDDPEQKVGT